MRGSGGCCGFGSKVGYVMGLFFFENIRDAKLLDCWIGIHSI